MEIEEFKDGVVFSTIINGENRNVKLDCKLAENCFCQNQLNLNSNMDITNCNNSKAIIDSSVYDIEFVDANKLKLTLRSEIIELNISECNLIPVNYY